MYGIRSELERVYCKDIGAKANLLWCDFYSRLIAHLTSATCFTGGRKQTKLDMAVLPKVVGIAAFRVRGQGYGGGH